MWSDELIKRLAELEKEVERLKTFEVPKSGSAGPYVRKIGDSMTGALTVNNNVTLTGQLSIDQAGYVAPNEYVRIGNGAGVNADLSGAGANWYGITMHPLFKATGDAAYHIASYSRMNTIGDAAHTLDAQVGHYIATGTVDANMSGHVTKAYGMIVEAPSVGGTNVGIQNNGCLIQVGNQSIGRLVYTTSDPNSMLRIGGDTTADYDLSGSVNKIGLRLTPSFQQTGNISTLRGQYVETCVLGSFTVTSLYQGHFDTGAKAAGATVTSAYGVKIGPQTLGSTNNYGLHIDAPSGGSGANIGLYNAGSTQLVGNVGFYGNTPIAKPTGVAVTAAGIHAALVSLGLIAP